MKQSISHNINVMKVIASFELLNGNVVKREFLGSAVWLMPVRRIDVKNAPQQFVEFLKFSNSIGMFNLEPNVYIPFSFVHRVTTEVSEHTVTLTEQ